MRPGMGRGFTSGGVGSEGTIGILIPCLVEKCKNFLIKFLIRGYVGRIMEADRDVRPRPNLVEAALPGPSAGRNGDGARAGNPPAEIAWRSLLSFDRVIQGVIGT